MSLCRERMGTDRASSKRERHCEPGDNLDNFGFVNIVRGAFDEAEEIYEVAPHCSIASLGC